MGRSDRHETDKDDDGGDDDGFSKKARPLRFESHALVEIRTKNWNPFSVVSAVLLDISWQGFKLEFVSPVRRIKQGSLLTMSIPLSAFQILSPAKLKLKIEIKWFDGEAWRAGGIFEQPTEEQGYILEKILHQITSNRSRQAAQIRVTSKP